VEGLYWYYVPARKEILHLCPGGGGARPGAVLKAHSLVDGTDRVVATIDGLMPSLAVAPDGRRFAYGTTSDQYSATARCDLAIMTLDGVREKVLVPAQTPCPVPSGWSPDGRFLLFNFRRSFTLPGTLEPRVMNVDTGESWPLHADIENQEGWSAGSWAPDGSFVLVTRSSSRSAWPGKASRTTPSRAHGPEVTGRRPLSPAPAGRPPCPGPWTPTRAAGPRLGGARRAGPALPPWTDPLRRGSGTPIAP
jgi:hypothetical protein